MVAPPITPRVSIKNILLATDFSPCSLSTLPTPPNSPSSSTRRFMLSTLFPSRCGSGRRQRCYRWRLIESGIMPKAK